MQSKLDEGNLAEKERKKCRRESPFSLLVSIVRSSDILENTYAIFSEGARHGTSSSSSSSLSSPSSPSSFPDTLNEDDVNISGTGKIDGLRLPVKLKKKTKRTRTLFS